ncbi:hypothetical protein Srufu_077270 [Streptomyces libani subsp. rufus]|nr:hypothetical protein Srufu_077270 [Streptomyces libani subsp. rufus]
MGGRAGPDIEAVRSGGEGHIDVDADPVGVALGAFLVGERPEPVVGLLVQDLVRGAFVVAGVKGGDDRVLAGRLGGRGVDRLGQGAGVRAGHP